MKVLFCLRSYLPEAVAGTEIYADALCKNLRDLGIDTVVIKPGYGKTEIDSYYFKEQRVVEYPESADLDKDLITGRRPPSGIHLFEKLLVAEKPDIIHFHQITGSNGITMAHVDIARKLNIPIFFTLHLVGYVCRTEKLLFKNKITCDGVIRTYDCSVCCLDKRGMHYGSAEAITKAGISLKDSRLLNMLPGAVAGLLSYPEYIDTHRNFLHQIFEASEKVFVLSQWFLEVLQRNGMPGAKMHLLQKALPHSEVPKARPRMITPFIKMVYLGRISEIKGLHIVFAALDKISLHNWTLDIYGPVGEIDYEEKCKKNAFKHGQRINFHGALSPDKVLPILQQYDVLVCPTVILEMVGIVVMEAFAAGLPVIGSDSKGIAEQVRDGVDGLLFPSGSADELAKIFNKILKEPEILARLKNNIIRPLSFDHIAKDVLDEYANALNKVAAQ